MEDKDKFPRISKNAFGDQTGWLYAGALVACAYELIKETEVYMVRAALDPWAKDGCQKAITKLKDTIDATMEAAYAPTLPASETPPKDESWQQP